MRTSGISAAGPILAGAAFLAAVGIVTLAGSGTGSGGYAIAQTTRVLHATGKLEASASSRTDVTTHELWFDPATLDTKYETASADGARITRLRQGRSKLTYFHDRNSLIRDTATTAQSPMLEVAARLLAYRSSLQRQQLRVVAQGHVAGRPAVLVQGNAFGLQAHSWLDRTSLMPLEETFFDRAGNVIERDKWTWSVLEELARENVPGSAFSLSVPSSAASVTSTYLTVSEASALRDFAVYYLGDPYGELPLFAITHRVLSGTGPLAPSETRTNVAITYMKGDMRISLDEISASSHSPREAAPGVPLPGKAVSVNGRPGTLYVDSGGADLELELDDTVVTLFGSSPDQVLTAAAQLRRLN